MGDKMDRYKVANRASVLGIVGNLFLLIIKGMVAFFTNSQAMFSDTFNSAGDIFSSLLTFIGNKIASKKADNDHNLGHGKAEYIFAMLISLTMIIIAIRLCVSSIVSIFRGSSYVFSPILIVVCILTIVIKFCLYMYTHNISKKYHNLLIEANAKDHRNDCVLTTFTLVASVFGMYGIIVVDGIVGSLVAIWIVIVSVKLFKESYDVLMDSSIDENSKNQVYDIIKKYPEIRKVTHFNATPVGFQYQVSLTIFVDGNMSTFESHKIADCLEKEITKLDQIYLTIIHVNPINIVNSDNK